ncbi:hypothetical protein GCM10010214_49150 [Streptomyces abikoensis]|nr:hypothetical protein GCM10010214_49150 [Streptomyces abikoensis]
MFHEGSVMPRNPLTFLSSGRPFRSLAEGPGLGSSPPDDEHPATRRTAAVARAAAVLLITFT